MNWAAGLLLLGFCSAHGIAAFAWSSRRSPVSAPSVRFGLPNWAPWAWIIATQAGNFAGLRVIERQSIGLPVAAAALTATCGLAIATDRWLKGGTPSWHHAIRIAVAAVILGLAAFAL